MIEGQNKQQSLDDEDVLCELDGDDEDFANNDMEGSVISGKSFGYIMDDYFGVHLNTMAEVFKDINDDKLQV